jgi:glycosyltransferase involved in cell wall biosynthesis
MQLLPQTDAVEVSVVIPCLNEQDTLATCIEKARRALREHHITGEILVADNGSTDLSQTIAEREGARVVAVNEPGYGSALMGGIAAATGRFIIIGDADDSCDFLELPKIVGKLREGFDLVQAAAFPLAVVRFAPVRCPFYIVGSATRFFPFLHGNGSTRRSTTFTAVCAVLPKPCTDGLTSVAPVWSSPRR